MYLGNVNAQRNNSQKESFTIFSGLGGGSATTFAIILEAFAGDFRLTGEGFEILATARTMKERDKLREANKTNELN